MIKRNYVKYMCLCGLNIGTFELENLKCPTCKRKMKFKIMVDAYDDDEWRNIKYEDCQ